MTFEYYDEKAMKLLMNMICQMFNSTDVMYMYMYTTNKYIQTNQTVIYRDVPDCTLNVQGNVISYINTSKIHVILV